MPLKKPKKTIFFNCFCFSASVSLFLNFNLCLCGRDGFDRNNLDSKFSLIKVPRIFLRFS